MLNIHFSLLPKYRGAIPVEAAILNGETETGISIQKMVKKMDEGDLLINYPVSIEPFENAGELQSRMDACLPELLGKLFEKPFPNWRFMPQVGEPIFCYICELSRENAKLEWRQEIVADFVNKVRGFSPEPKAWIEVEKNGAKKVLNILRAQPFIGGDFSVQDYQFIKKQGLALQLRDGAVLLTEIVLEGSKMVKNGDIVSLKGSIIL
jgi:methionyl-tRNA formyltransferase